MLRGGWLRLGVRQHLCIVVMISLRSSYSSTVGLVRGGVDLVDLMRG